jgi:fatty-acyl-CoA synthase
VLEQWLLGHPSDRAALRFEGRTVPYGELAQRAGYLAGALVRLGVRRGDRVAVLGYNTPDFLALVFACARLGAILVPLNWRLAAPEHAYILRDAEPVALIHDADLAPAAEAIGRELPLLLPSHA